MTFGRSHRATRAAEARPPRLDDVLPAVASLELELFDDVVAAVDLLSLSALAQMLWIELEERASRGELPGLAPATRGGRIDDASDEVLTRLASELISRGLRRVASEPRRWTEASRSTVDPHPLPLDAGCHQPFRATWATFLHNAPAARDAPTTW